MSARVPHPSLRPYVSAMVGYRDVLDPRAVHHGLPAPTLTVILAFDEPLDAGWVDTPAESSRFWTCAAGLHATPALIRTHGFQHGIQLALTPLGARALLGVPAAALGDTMVAHDDLPLGVTAGLHAQLAGERGWEQRFDVLERHLVSLVRRHTVDPAHAAPAEVQAAWRAIQESHGSVRVGDLAERLGWSRRRLLTAFRAEYGLSPKEAARVARFDHTRRLVDDGVPLADASARGGYADQAHLAREWSTLAGRTPTQLRASSYHVA